MKLINSHGSHQHLKLLKKLAQLAGAIEYTNYISAEE